MSDIERPSYSARNGAIVGGEFDRFNNRPIYANNRDDLVIGGDRPMIRFGRNPFLYGTMTIGLMRDDQFYWLHEAEKVEMSYRAGRLEWRISDRRTPDLVIELKVVPTVNATGLAVRLQGQGSRPQDLLFWTFGGLVSGINPNAAFDAAVSDEVLARGFVPEDSRDNFVELLADGFAISSAPTTFPTDSSPTTIGRTLGRCHCPSEYSVQDASTYKDWPTATEGHSQKNPIVCAKTGLTDEPIYWGFQGTPDKDSIDRSIIDDPVTAFSAGWERGERLAERCVVTSPHPQLNALASASVATVDGTWYPPYFVHGAMLWNVPYPGWRTIYGGTIFGWPDRLLETARYFIASQITESDKTQALADPERLLTIQAEGSRFYGKGRVTAHAAFYDMQSQFFDQLITEWRWHANPELERILKPALDLHLEWLQECFDPDQDGAYESGINSWPTDSVWYNGGGSCEATSYAYRGHQAALEMAQRAKDQDAAVFHSKMIRRIHDGFFKQLWIKRLGHPGKYREQGGHQRLHEDPWLYSIFLPIDAGLLSREQAATALNYTRASLQNDPKKSGGRMVWNSNWVPSIWSTRTDWPGDNYALALAYYQAGFADEGWEIFSGTFLTSAFDLTCPGNFGHKAGGYDFGDCSHTFSRTLVEGLFGYNPDYPNHLVRLRTLLPSSWDKASLSLPDISITYARSAGAIRYEVTLKTAAALDIQVPVIAGKIHQVLVDGQETVFERLPGVNAGIVSIQLTKRLKATVDISFTEAFVPMAPLSLTREVGETLELSFQDASIKRLLGDQEVLEISSMKDGVVSGTVADNIGKHLLLAEVTIGETSLLRVIYLEVKNSLHAAEKASQILQTVPQRSKWKLIDLTEVRNGDIRKIFKQQYLTPRPDTVSVRIGLDGWTPWSSSFWKHTPPDIALNQIPRLNQGDGSILTPQGVPFAWPEGSDNIAFTSLWDNFPTSVTVPTHTKGNGLWLLIAGSTNPMQCQIANAVLRLNYDDGSEQTFELIPPQNFWAVAPIRISGTEKGQEGRHDYTDPHDAYCVPQPHPDTVTLGTNCRAMLYGLRLNSQAVLQTVTLEALSQEIVIGVLGMSVSTDFASS